MGSKGCNGYTQKECGCDKFDERMCNCSLDYITMPGVRREDLHKEYYMRLRVPGEGHLLEKMWDEARARRHSHVKARTKIEDQTALENKADFVNKTSAKCDMMELQREVELGLQLAQLQLEAKRNKLKNVIMQENVLLLEEYNDKVKNLPKMRFEEKKQRANEIMERKEKEKGGEAKEKLEQQERENSEELRDKISLVKKLEAAEIQKHQICEKKIQLQREDEFDTYWLQMQNKRDEERLKYEEEEEQIRLTRIKQQREVLNKQILGKKMMKDEMKNVIEKEAALMDELKERIRQEDEEIKQFNALQKKRQMTIQQAQLADSRRLKRERELEAQAFDNYFIKKLNESILEEKQLQSDTRAEERKEAEFFKQQLKEIRAVQADEEREIEELRRQEVEKKEATIRNNRLILKEARDKLQRETIETWKQQLIYKQNTLAADKAADRVYDERSKDLLQINKDLDQLLQDKTRRVDVERIKDSEWQQKYEKLLKDREMREENEMLRKTEEEARKKDERMMSVGTCFGPPHPFTKVIYDNN